MRFGSWNSGVRRPAVVCIAWLDDFEFTLIAGTDNVPMTRCVDVSYTLSLSMLVENRFKIVDDRIVICSDIPFALVGDDNRAIETTEYRKRVGAIRRVGRVAPMSK